METLFNAGDKVFVLHNGKAVYVEIYNVDTKQTKENFEIKYWFKFDNASALYGYDFISKQESELFETKEQLIKSLD